MFTSRVPRCLAFAIGGSIAAIATSAVCLAGPAATSSIETVGGDAAPGGTALQPAVRVHIPDQPSTSSPAIVNRSTCRTGAHAAMQITIADISYDCPVYAGGQTTIDAGFVTLVNDRTSPLLATRPGGAGTLWLAAHRSSHGGAFAAVPSLTDGAIITITRGTMQWRYVVVGRAYVEVRNGVVVDDTGRATQAATVEAVFRTDGGGNRAPRLLLQTCDGEDHRWMIYADLVTRTVRASSR